MPRVTSCAVGHRKPPSWSVRKHRCYWPTDVRQISLTGVYRRSAGILPCARIKRALFGVLWGPGIRGTRNSVISLLLNRLFGFAREQQQLRAHGSRRACCSHSGHPAHPPSPPACSRAPAPPSTSLPTLDIPRFYSSCSRGCEAGSHGGFDQIIYLSRVKT